MPGDYQPPHRLYLPYLASASNVRENVVSLSVWQQQEASGHLLLSWVERERTHGIRALASSMPSIDLFLVRGAVLEGWLWGHLSCVPGPLWERKLVFRVLCFLSPESFMLPCWPRAPSPVDLSLRNCTVEGLLCQAAMLSSSEVNVNLISQP